MVRVTFKIMTKHGYLPTTMILDNPSIFKSHVIEEVAGVLGFIVKHATTKHKQTIVMLERSHASIKETLKIGTGERRSLWQKHVSIAVLNCKTTYHANNGCEPSRVFHGRSSHIVLNLTKGIRPQKITQPNSQVAQYVLEQIEMVYQDARRNAMVAYIKYKSYYHKKANASKLQGKDHVCLTA